MMAARGDAAGTSGARRRRERRLRSWAKHERLSVAMALAEKLHHSANRTVLPKEEEVEQDYALRGQKPARAGARHAVPFRWRRERAGASGGAFSCRLGFSGTPWSTGSSTRFTCRSSTLLCRRWRTSCWMCSGPSTARLPSRSSKCPSCRAFRVLPVRLVWNRRWRNKWWMCRRCCRMPCSSSGMCAQIVDIPVPLDRVRRLQDSLPRRVQQRPVLSRSLTVLLVEAFTVFSQGWFLQRPASSSLLTVLLEVFKVFPPGRESGQRSAEQNVDFPAPSFRSPRARRTAEQNVDILRRSWWSSRFFSRTEFHTAYCDAER